MVDSTGVIQPSKNTLDHLGFEYDWSKSNPSEIAELVLVTNASTEKSTILTRLIGGEIVLTQKGYRVRQAADGYLNERVFIDGKRRFVQVPDPDRAKFYVAMFELRATRDLSDQEIVDRVNAMGYRRRTFKRWNIDKTKVLGCGGGGPLSLARFQEIIRNPIYCGVVYEKWTHWKPIKAPYAGLVSIETYNAANRGKRYIREHGGELELLHDYFPDRQTRVLSRTNPLFPFKNVIMCPACQKPFRGSASRGSGGKSFPAYHCNRKHKRIGISKPTFEKIVHHFVNELRVDEDLRIALLQACYDRYRNREQERGEARADIERTVADLEVQKAEAVRAYMGATGDVMRRALEAEVDRLDAEIAQAGGQEAATYVSDADFEGYLRDVQEMLEHPKKLLENPANMQAQRSSYQLVFNPLPTIQELDIGTAKLTPIFRAFCDQEGVKSGLADQPGFGWNELRDEIVRWRAFRQPTPPPKPRPLSATFKPTLKRRNDPPFR
jgi:hypothetical protein